MDLHRIGRGPSGAPRSASATRYRPCIRDPRLRRVPRGHGSLLPPGKWPARASGQAAWNVAPVGFNQSVPLFHAPFAAVAVEKIERRTNGAVVQERKGQRESGGRGLKAALREPPSRCERVVRESRLAGLGVRVGTSALGGSGRPSLRIAPWDGNTPTKGAAEPRRGLPVQGTPCS